MKTTALALTSLGMPLNASAAALGDLRSSTELVDNPDALRARMREDGYLFLRGYLDRAEVLEVRDEITRRLADLGLLDEDSLPIEAVSRPGTAAPDMDAITARNVPLEKLLYSGRMTDFYAKFLGGPVRHYDFTWFRAMPGGGRGTYPHCDVVYMGRGTRNVFTAWTPIGDVPMEIGGLMILENSHLQADKLRRYLERDVDAYCVNRSDAPEIESGRKQWQDWDGRLSSDPVSLREKLGGRWLTTEFQAGDVLTFTMGTVHASLDNQSNRFRLSSDSRYQLASEPVDERWVGEKPVGHGVAGKKGKVC
ncbi:MAG: phytanoyl-CoA dioxygenase family protein [Terrimicrobiaceae bacterium]|nr:phytanoyl-CoA dioxygenase family protein [Terrimicrobiaceae bacterium]